MTSEHPLDHLWIFEVQALVVTGREQVEVDAGKRRREVVADDDASLQREDAGVLLRLFPHSRLTFGDVCLAEREREEPDLPVSSGRKAGQDVLVRVAGEGAAVVPRHGK